MSDKDQKLIVFVIIFAIVALGLYYGVRPALKSMTEIKSEIEDEKENQSINKLKVAQLPMLEMTSGDTEEKIKEKRKEFFDMFTSDEVDRMLTGMALGHKLYSYDMDIVMPNGPRQLDAYQYSTLYETLKYAEAYEKTEKEKQQEEEAAASKKNSTTSELDEIDAAMDEDSSDTEPDSKNTNTGVYSVEVKMTVGGSTEDLQAFLNELINYDKRIFIKQYSWGELRSMTPAEITVMDQQGNLITDTTGELPETTVTVTKEGEIVNIRTLTVDIELYMCEQPKDEE